MPRRKPPAVLPSLRALIPSWELHLKSENKAAGTIEGYLSRVGMYLDWCIERRYQQVITRDQVSEFIADQLEQYAAGTVVSRLVGLKRFSWWLTEVRGVYDVDPIAGMRPPATDDPVLEPLTDEQLQALLQACRGRARTLRQMAFRDVRDEAAARVFIQTGMRAGELVALAVDDVDLKEGTLIIRRGKGRKGRIVQIGPKTVVAIDRYLAKRAGHRLAGGPKLFLGDGGKGWGYDAVRTALKARAQAAGIEDFHLHKLRHTQAHRWLEKGGSESGLMANNGWSRHESLRRYSKARALERAREEARRLDLGDV